MATSELANMTFTTLIIGNGVAGPILAMALQKTTKHKIILVDAGPEETLPLGASLAITANGMRRSSSLLVNATTTHLLHFQTLLNFIDAQDIVLKKGAQLSYMRMRRGEREDADKPLIDERVEELFIRKWGYAPHGIVRQEYCRSLRALAKERGVDMRFGMRLKSIEEHDNKVTAHFVDGKSIVADLLVGCDGIHSLVRAHVVGEDIKPDYANASLIIGLANLTKEEEESVGITGPGFNGFIGHGANMLTFSANTQGEYGWFLGFYTPDPAAGETPWGDAHSTEKVTALALSKIEGWKATAPAMFIKKTSRIIPLGLYDRRPLNKWHKGRVVLLGDSAHPTTPYGGQGSQMAAESAVILARLLGEGEPSDELFARYAALRHPRTDWVTANGRRMIGTLLVSPILEYLRDTLLSFFGGMVLRSGMLGHISFNASTAPL